MIRILLCFLLLSFSGLSQYSRLELSVHGYLTKDDCKRILILHSTDTIFNELLDYDGLYEEIDSLVPGTGYAAQIYVCDQPLPESNYRFELHADSLTQLNLHSRPFYEEVLAIDPETQKEIEVRRSEVQVSLSYFDNRWIDPKAKLTSTYNYSVTGYGDFAFSKHAGFLIGGGGGFTHSSISRDTTFMSLTQQQKRYEYYNYLDFNFDLKFRFSAGNQQVAGLTAAKFIIDLGARYNFPVLFRHSAWYKGGKKIENLGLHQFTDVRLYINIGSPIAQFFFEYRPFDFIIGNYPELSRYNAGLKFAFSY